MIGFLKLLIVVFFFFCGFVFSQEHHFTIKNIEVPSQECYNIFQDSKGYIWFSTVRGFCKYDGKTVLVFDRTRGLNENSVYSVSEDDKGRIWVLTRNNRILYIENDVLVEPSFSKKFEKLNEFSLANFAHHFQFSNNYNEMIVYSFLNTYLINVDTGEITIVSKDKKDSNVVELKYVGGKIGQSSPNSYGVRNVIDLKIFDESGTELFRKDQMSVNTTFLHKIIRSKDVGATSYFSFANLLFQFNRKTNELKQIGLDGRIISIYKDKTNGIWVGVVGSGLYYFGDGDISKQPIHSLRTHSVSGIVEDWEGGIWATTLNKGIFYAANKHLVSYRAFEGLNMATTSLSTFQGKVFVGTENLKLFQIDQSAISEVKIGKRISEFITDVVPFKKSIFIGNLFSTIQTDSNWKNVKSSVSDNTVSVFPSSRMHHYKGKLYVALNNYLFEYNELIDKFELILKSPIKIRDFYKLDDDRWLLGGRSLVVFNQTTNEYEKLKGFEGVVSKIIKQKNGTLLISTVEAGLFRYENNELVNLNSLNSKIPIVLYDICVDNHGILWMASNNGLIRYDLQLNEIKRYGTQDGIISNDIQRLAICDGYLFMSTVEGLCSVPLESFKQAPVTPTIFYNGSFFNGKKVDLRNEPTISYSNNNLMIKSRIASYANRNVYLSYALLLNGDTLNHEIVDGTDLVLDNLSPGSYKLIMHAVNDDGERGNELAFKYKIKAPFWKTGWFVFAMILLLGLLIYLIFKVYVSAIRIREEKKTHINELIANSKLMALQSQMNPHFIFNAINSIQNFILKRDVNQAYDYLTMFSRLIRLVLQNSRSKETTLKEEIKVIHLYITLEQLRFDNQFEFNVDIAPNVDIDNIYIPPMLIQPILENSIWHGIMPLRGERLGKVNLNIQVEQDLLKIAVEDNGVGRITVPKDTIHESISMEVTRERLDIVNMLHDDKRAKIEIIDLTDSNGVACGTKVLLYVPLEREE